MPPHGLMFHHFHGDRPPHGQGSITARQFRELLDFVGRERILPAWEWQQRAAHGALGSDDLCLTFDDNLRCQFDVALPVMREAGLTGLWFIQTAVIEGTSERLEIDRAFRMRCFAGMDAFYGAFERYLMESPLAGPVELGLREFNPRTYLAEYPFYTDGDRRFRFLRDRVLGPQRYGEVMNALIDARGVNVEELAADLWMDEACLRQLHAEGHVIGLHSHTHPTCLAELPIEAQRQEYARNHAILADLLGESPVAMSHPCNSYTDQTLEILRDLGVQVGFRSNATLQTHGPLEQPREDHTSILRQMQNIPVHCDRATTP